MTELAEPPRSVPGELTAPAPFPAVAGQAAQAPGYRPRRTLPLAVEAVRQLRRRRTLITFGLLLVLPWILVGAFELGGNGAADPQTPGLVTTATAGGLNFAAFAFFASAGFLLVVAVALFCGDTVATEASWASLRYLLAAPVPRARLLRQKLTVALGYSFVAIVVVPLMALLAGTVAWGWHPLKLPGSGVQLSTGVALGRLAIILCYVLITEVVVAAIAFVLSVSTDSPLGAVGGAVGVVIVSNIIDAITALGAWRRLLPTHWQFSWLNALQPQISWTPMIEGAVVSFCYAVVLIALAFRRFRAKDIVS